LLVSILTNTQGITHKIRRQSAVAATLPDISTIGGWTLIYVSALGIALFLRWRSGAWRRLRF